VAYAEELLELAQELANLHPDSPHQPSLRRAVSTAYYALFHLLISEATANWQRPELRAALGRVFDHGPMKQAADKKVTELNNYFKTKPPEGPGKTVALHLRNVAETFGQAQYHRNEADYNIAREWNSNCGLTAQRPGDRSNARTGAAGIRKSSVYPTPPSERDPGPPHSTHTRQWALSGQMT